MTEAGSPGAGHHGGAYETCFTSLGSLSSSSHSACPVTKAPSDERTAGPFSRNQCSVGWMSAITSGRDSNLVGTSSPVSMVIALCLRGCGGRRATGEHATRSDVPSNLRAGASASSHCNASCGAVGPGPRAAQLALSLR